MKIWTSSLRGTYEIRLGLCALLVGLLGCGGSGKSVKRDVARERLLQHRHVLVVGGGPILVNLDAGGLAGKMMMKGLNRIFEKDSDSSIADDLRKVGLLPRDTVVEAGVAVLTELGWQATPARLVVESPGKNFDGMKAPDGACEEAMATGADSAMLLYERLTIDVNATDAFAKSELWAHLFDCPTRQPMLRERDRASLSLNGFVIEAAKKVIGMKNKTLADFLASIRNLVVGSTRKVLQAKMVR
jgi:hypothetical protein